MPRGPSRLFQSLETSDVLLVQGDVTEEVLFCLALHHLTARSHLPDQDSHHLPYESKPEGFQCHKRVSFRQRHLLCFPGVILARLLHIATDITVDSRRPPFLTLS